MHGFMRASVLLFVAVALIAGTFVAQSLSTVNTAQVEALWKDYVVAKKRLQYDVARMLGDEWPELQGIAGLQRDHQFALIELRNMKFRYLLAFDPDRIVYDNGLSQFANFEWTEADSEALRTSNPEFGKLERWADSNSKRLSEHPKLAVAGDHFVSLQSHEGYQSLIKRYQARMDDLESALDTISRARKDAQRRKTQEARQGG